MKPKLVYLKSMPYYIIVYQYRQDLTICMLWKFADYSKINFNESQTIIQDISQILYDSINKYNINIGIQETSIQAYNYLSFNNINLSIKTNINNSTGTIISRELFSCINTIYSDFQT